MRRADLVADARAYYATVLCSAVLHCKLCCTGLNLMLRACSRCRGAEQPQPEGARDAGAARCSVLHHFACPGVTLTVAPRRLAGPAFGRRSLERVSGWG